MSRMQLRRLNIPAGTVDGTYGLVVASERVTGLGVAGGGGALDDLTDVDLTTTPPGGGDALVFNAGAGLWVPGSWTAGAGFEHPLTTPGDLMVWSSAGTTTVTLENETPTGITTANASPSTTERIVADMDLDLPAVGTTVDILINMWWSMNQNGVAKDVTLRLRRDNLVGTVLASNTQAATVDSSAGHDRQWSTTFNDVAPTTGHYVVTAQAVSASSVAIMSDTRIMEVSTTMPGSVVRLPVGADDTVLTADSSVPEGVTWAGVGGIGGVAFPLDTAPTSPHAKDDEFTGTVLDAKWLNPVISAVGHELTLVVEKGAVRFEPATTGTASTGKRAFGIRQVAPTGSFTVTAKVANVGDSAEARCGIFVARTASGQGHILGNMRGGTNRIANGTRFTGYSETVDWGAFDTFDPNVTAYWAGVMWFQIVWDSVAGSLTFNWSADGHLWNLLSTMTGVLQPDRIGLAMWSNGTSTKASQSLSCDWFRVTEP